MSDEIGRNIAINKFLLNFFNFNFLVDGSTKKH